MKSKIYTKTGDNGMTQFGVFGKEHKNSKGIFLLSKLDSVNSGIGLLLSSQNVLSNDHTEMFVRIQNKIFEIGSIVAGYTSFQITEEDISVLEIYIDVIDGKLPALSNFILPGGGIISSQIHEVRTRVREAECHFVDFLESSGNRAVRSASRISDLSFCLRFLNRLSDLCFVFARFYNNCGKSDVIWNAK